jgi:ABC-2 type transport system ATP-binding protein
VIEVQHLRKSYGRTVAVDGLSFTVEPGRVTGFVGPNGAGKSTTMRVMLALETPDSGQVTINGLTHRELETPLRTVGSLLDGAGFHPGRTARDHLTYLAVSNKLPRSRVREVLDLAGLASVAHKRVGRFSLGMKQRLGVAAALLGDPPVLVMDEPTNGLDPEGIVWLRDLLTRSAVEGRTVLVSSHLMSEIALTAQHLVVIGRGQLVADLPVPDLVATASRSAGTALSLEEAYFELTRTHQEFSTTTPGVAATDGMTP